MKRILYIAIVLLVGCSSTQLVDNWKNPDIITYDPTKVLVVGMTSNIEAREKFELQIKKEYEARDIDAVMSLELFEPSFTTEEKTEEELKLIENILIENGFDTILFSKVIGVEDRISYRSNYDGYDETYKKFKEDYLRYQDVFYNPDYYDEYKVYHAETSMYCICPTKDRELIWKGYIDITDPISVDKTVSDYTKLLVVAMEEHQILPRIESSTN